MGSPQRRAARLVLEEVEDAADVRVRDLPRQLHLAAEAPQAALVVGGLGADRLEGDTVAQGEVLAS